MIPKIGDKFAEEIKPKTSQIFITFARSQFVHISNVILKNSPMTYVFETPWETYGDAIKNPD